MVTSLEWNDAINNRSFPLKNIGELILLSPSFLSFLPVAPSVMLSVPSGNLSQNVSWSTIFFSSVSPPLQFLRECFHGLMIDDVIYFTVPVL
jgi:hypothetical protein